MRGINIARSLPDVSSLYSKEKSAWDILDLYEVI